MPLQIQRAADLAASRLATAQINAEMLLERRQQELADQITGHVSYSEMASWPAKEAAALAHNAASATAEQTAMLTAEAAMTGETVQELADLILAKAAAYKSVVGTLRGIVRKGIHAAKAASDVAGVDAALAQFEADAAAFLAGLP